jgi:hypothetical protein
VALAAALETMRAGETAEATAEAIVVAVLGLPGLVGAGVWSFEPTGEVVPLANVHRDAGALSTPGPLSAERAAYLRERASHGPWIEAWRDRPEHPYNALAVRHAIRSLAYAPIDRAVASSASSSLPGTATSSASPSACRSSSSARRSPGRSWGPTCEHGPSRP